MTESWMTTYDAVFFISVGTMASGLIALIIKYCLKSKCEHFNLCYGLINIDRRVDLEVQEEMHAIDAGITDIEQPLQTTQPQQMNQINQTRQLRPNRRPSNNESDNLEIIALENRI